jgi:parallel beta-helix repeat protein
VFLVVLGAAATAAGGAIYVDADAGGANNGSSWTDAYRYLQDGLAAAQYWDEIWVAKGIYKPDQGAGITPGDRRATFQLKNGVSIQGGYAGSGEPDPNAWDVEAYETILSGDLLGNDGADFANNDENSYHVVTGSWTNTTALLYGFTITAGNANGPDWDHPRNRGGGMYSKSGSPMVMNCRFTRNQALGQGWGFGGGMCNDRSSPRVMNCTFSDNWATEQGGGMSNSDHSNPVVEDCTFSENRCEWAGAGMCNDQSSPTVTNCAFSGNSANRDGGGMANFVGSSPTLANCTFSGNRANYDGGGMCNRESSPTVTNCTFSGNSANHGGGISNWPGSPTVRDCTFSSNSAELGGGVFNWGSSPTLTNCVLSKNSSREWGGGMCNLNASTPTLVNCGFSGNLAENSGGGMYNDDSSPTLTDCTFSSNSAGEGGGMRNWDNSNTTLVNCVFSGNSAEVGGGVANYSSSPTVLNCEFSANSANFGGGMYNRDSDPILTNCTFSGNFATINHGGGIYNCDSSSPTLTGCTFSGNSARTGGGIMNLRSSPTLTDCTFNGNSASESGGGMENNDNSNSTLINCTFSRNSAVKKGGGMHNCRDSSPILFNCTFSVNSSATFGGGGMFNQSSNSMLTNCTFSGNFAAGDGIYNRGGGMCNAFSNSTIVNCTFIGNSASNCGGGVYSNCSSLTLTNCTFSGNLASGGSALACDSWQQENPSNLRLTNCILWDGGNEIWNNDNSVITITYSDVQGGWPGTGNINANPLFVDPAIGDYHLLTDSPCIDAGDNLAVPPSVVTDLDGKPRIINGTVDMGAYEFHCPGILYVDVDAAGANDGSCWADAFNYLQDALTVAWNGDEIWVSEGIYKPDEGVGITPGDRTATFQLKNGITIKGSYAGFGEPDPNARDIELYETILSGDLLGNDGPDFANNGENSYHVVTGSGTNATAVLDGFTITAGNANQDYPSPYRLGGGMYNYTGSPTLTNSKFRGNSGHAGGGMFNKDSSPTLLNCTFSGNSTSRVVFNENGAGMHNDNSHPKLTNCTFDRNSATDHGGGMFNTRNSEPMLVNCRFSDNRAVTQDGGGMMNGHGSRPTLINCIFSGNSAKDGGGMRNWSADPTLVNCTFSGNSARGNGGGVSTGVSWSKPKLTNCILWGNSDKDGVDESAQIYYGRPVVNYCCIQGWTGSLGGTGNIDADPRFGTPGSWEPIEETDMVSYWKFDEGGGTTAYDSAGDNDGTVYGAQWTIGQLGGALDFDGAGDYVGCGNDSSLNPTNNFSVSAWFNVNSVGPVPIVCKGNVPAYFPGGAYTIFSNYMNGTLHFCVRNSNNAGYGCTTASVSRNEWTHVVGTFSDGNISIYKNGAFVEGGVLGSPTIHSNNGPLGIGAEGDGGTPFNGIIDDVAIHNRALSSEEIEQLYQIGLSGRSDYHLLPDSPCINAGDPNYVAEPNETDLDGLPDMGAYEYPNTTPVACIVGSDRIVEAQGPFGARVTLDGSCSSDADSTPGTNNDIVCFDWYKVDACDPNFEDFIGSGEVIDCNLPLGEHIIVLEVTDKAGAFDTNEVTIIVAFDTNEVTIIVQDTTPPVFTLSVTPTTLWPVNHKMVLITPSWSASDICDESPEVSLVSITMNEDDEATGDGHTTDDIQVDDNGSIYLRAERSGAGSGRIYTITYQAVDCSGNAAVARATVTVPHDQR